ncbi:C-C motif chemokine 13-like [Salminus brasiliensis]|uniref:C-C motif chemokine 13-like n=1 Tax=Salminus brasiliensis TaxID=930266 RepID=UPI003B8390F6
MKPYCIATVCLLLFAFCSLTLTQSGHMPEKCCFKEKFMNKVIPQQRVIQFEKTSPGCKDSGIIFYTVLQKQICANPSEKWVTRLMKIVEERTKDANTVAGYGGDVAI